VAALLVPPPPPHTGENFVMLMRTAPGMGEATELTPLQEVSRQGVCVCDQLS
jgi:hypothetical protein